MFEPGDKVNILWGTYKDRSGEIVKWSGTAEFHIVKVENINFPGRFIEICLKSNEMEKVNEQ